MLKAAEQALDVKLIENGKSTQTLHDAVVGYQANRRAGTHQVKTKATVAASGKKPWRQKGTGNARAGYASSPVWTGGGVVFGPHPRDYSHRLSKGVKRRALTKALSEAAKSGRLQSIPALELKDHKSKQLSELIKANKLEGSILFITKAVDKNALLASRNMPKVEVIEAALVNAEHILTYRQVIWSEDACEVLSSRLK
ncbi:MAG: 50S ribosomal protein L4 [Blastochloris sp.]|nr:50S ribosomal protein L4 [Blastochloris sp.]